MYCVIQKVTNKKQNPYGAAREIKVGITTITWDGITKTHYYYTYSTEKFERPIKDAYKISIHKSYRENKKVKKRQWVICTMGYYDLLHSAVGDHIIYGDFKKKLKEMELEENQLWDMVYSKLQPIIDAVELEFKATEEYKVEQQHKRIIGKHIKAKKVFEDKYGADTYEYVYDVFGVLRNEKYLKELQANYKFQQSYKKSSYQQNNQSNYNNNYDFSSYFKNNDSNYTEEEKEYLKAIYRAAAIKLHPDIKKDNGESMKFLNKLKETWGI